MESKDVDTLSIVFNQFLKSWYGVVAENQGFLPQFVKVPLPRIWIYN